MKIQRTILALTLMLISVAIVTGQSIKDYYIPDTNHNKVNFFTPDKTGERSGFTRTIYYTDNGDGTYDILDAHMFQGQAASIITQTVLFTTAEVKMIKSISTSMITTNERENYDPPRILLKMPPVGQTVTWNIVANPDDKPTKYIASWTTVTVNGESRKAIKVVSQYTGWTSKTISYYVQGIGLMDTDLKGEDGMTKPFEKFDGLSYEATKR